MMISNKKNIYGDYNSFLKDYLCQENNYDNSTLLYSDKYGSPAFTITSPNLQYKNCDFISGYPHFQIPPEICLQEIKNFINNIPIYDKNFTIRYGDIHPNKPIPMLGQLRNIFIDDMFVKMIKTSGKINNIFTIGDISEKTIKYFIDEKKYEEKEKVFDLIFNGLLNNTDSNNKYVIEYLKFCKSRLKESNDFFQKLNIKNNSYLFESNLYTNETLYELVKKMKCKNGLKENGQIKYLLQEFMFFLNEEYFDTKIINIIGSNQSEHIKKVLQVVEENEIDCDLSFLTYNICKNAESRDIDEWSKVIEQKIYNNSIKVAGQYITYFDFLKFLMAINSSDNIIDFEKNKNLKINMIEEIYISLINANKKSCNNEITSNKLLNNMVLVNQVFDSAVISGDASKIVRYLYSLAKEFNSNQLEYENMNSLYYEFVIQCLDSISLLETDTFQKILKRR